MYESILVPTDGSKGAEIATRHAIDIATTFEASISVLYVVDSRAYSVDLADIDDFVDAQVEELEQHGQAAVDRIVRMVEDADLPVGSTIKRGVPYQQIPSYAEENDIDLIAMGTHGRTGLDRFLLGSVTERVVRTATVPVLTVREEDQPPRGFDDILLPTDGSEGSKAAEAHAIALASRYDARVHTIHVVDITALAGYADGPIPESVIDGLYAYGDEVTSDVAERVGEAGLQAVTDVLEGNPAQSIREYTVEQDIDLITMGTHGRTGITRFLIGSVAERTVRKAPVPVLTIRSS